METYEEIEFKNGERAKEYLVNNPLYRSHYNLKY